MKKGIVILRFICAISLIVVSVTGCNKVQPSENTTGGVYHLPDSATPVDYAKLACDTYMSTYDAEKLPPENALFYHQGVLLSGFERLYELTGDEKYFEYIKDYADSVTGPDGELVGVDHDYRLDSADSISAKALTMLDTKQPAILFYNLYDKTGDEKYLNVINTISESMYYWPINKHGGYWHMMTEPNQMWLDSAYMAGVLSVMYSDMTEDYRLMNRAIKQVLLMNEYMKDDATGLYYHGWDASHAMGWADKKTGLSEHFWGRAMGWYAVAILDMLDYIPQDHPSVPKLKKIEADLLDSLLKYQDGATGMWYQVVDKPGEKGNWIESSCTNLFLYSYAKALRTGIISGEKYEDALKKGYDGMIKNSIRIDADGKLVIDKICIGTCIEEGTYEHYINRPQTNNDLHGGGAFILMCTEMAKYLK